MDDGRPHRPNANPNARPALGVLLLCPLLCLSGALLVLQQVTGSTPLFIASIAASLATFAVGVALAAAWGRAPQPDHQTADAARLAELEPLRPAEHREDLP
jgi:hypothetical protein